MLETISPKKQISSSNSINPLKPFLLIGLGVIIGYLSSSYLQNKKAEPREDAAHSARQSRKSNKSHSSSLQQKLSSLNPKLATYQGKIDFLKNESTYITGAGIRSLGLDPIIYNNIKLVAASMSPDELQDTIIDLNTLQLSSSSKSWLRSIFFNQFAQTNPLQALEFIEIHKKDIRIAQQKNVVLRSWMKQDPEAATDWLQQNKNSLSHSDILTLQNDRIMQLAESDFPATIEKLKQLSTLDRKSAIFRLSYSMHGDLEKSQQLIDYLSTLKDTTLQIDTGIQLLHSITDASPEMGMAFIDQWPGKDKGRLETTLAESWAHSDPESALAWLTAQPLATATDINSHSNNYRDNSIGQIFSQWVLVDRDQATEWLDSHPSLDKDECYAATSRQVAVSGDITESFRWANKIENDNVRIKRYRDLVNRWQSQDFEGLKKWLIALPAETQKKITTGTILEHYPIDKK